MAYAPHKVSACFEVFGSTFDGLEDSYFQDSFPWALNLVNDYIAFTLAATDNSTGRVYSIIGISFE